MVDIENVKVAAVVYMYIKLLTYNVVHTTNFRITKKIEC